MRTVEHGSRQSLRQLAATALGMRRARAENAPYRCEMMRWQAAANAHLMSASRRIAGTSGYTSDLCPPLGRFFARLWRRQ
jgi:hypothetical protein